MIGEWMLLAAAAWRKFRPQRAFLILYALVGLLGTPLIIAAGRWPGKQAEFRVAVDLLLFGLPLIQIALLPPANRNDALI